MTAPIRPGLPPASASTRQRSAQTLTAQRAFFSAAMDRAGAPAAPSAAAPQPQTAPARAAATTTSTPDTEADAYPRLGRYLDIRV